jgi:hypothetical protein
MRSVTLRCVVLAILAVAFSDSKGFAQQPSRSAPVRTAELDGILDTWARNSAQINTLSCKFARRDIRPGFGRHDFLYTVRWKNSGKADVNIDEIVGPNKSQQRERLLWSEREVWEFTPSKKEVRLWPMEQVREYEAFRAMVKDYWAGRLAGNQFDLIFGSLSSPKEVDPLPFLIGMKDVLAKKRFTYEFFAGAEPRQLVVRATPVQTSPKSLFNDVLITLDNERLLPVALEYRRGRLNRDTRRYTLLEVQLNQAIDDATFEPHIPNGWRLEKERD